MCRRCWRRRKETLNTHNLAQAPSRHPKRRRCIAKLSALRQPPHHAHHALLRADTRERRPRWLDRYVWPVWLRYEPALTRTTAPNGPACWAACSRNCTTYALPCLAIDPSPIADTRDRSFTTTFPRHRSRYPLPYRPPSTRKSSRRPRRVSRATPRRKNWRSPMASRTRMSHRQTARVALRRTTPR